MAPQQQQQQPQHLQIHEPRHHHRCRCRCPPPAIWRSRAQSMVYSPTFRRWSALALVVVWLPLWGTYWELHRWLAAERCVLIATPASGSSSGGGINSHVVACRWTASTHGDLAKRATTGFSLSPISPPGIAGLATLLGARTSYRDLPPTTARDNVDAYFYAEESPLGDWFGTSSAVTHSWEITPEGAIDYSTLGYKQYDKKGAVDKHGSSKGYPNEGSTVNDPLVVATPTTAPTATYFWLALNVGLYGWFWHNKVDSGTVAMNGALLAGTRYHNHDQTGDFGRALSGNLSHFEVWHLGFNAMSLVTLGEVLESSSLAGPGLHLWTGSFLALVAVGVVFLRAVDLRLGPLLWRRHQRQLSLPKRFPGMVGFSGILFAWSSYASLSLPEHQQVCPIPLLSSVCFETHTLRGGLKFSWGPIVQLVVVQLLLNRRVSFVGHLSGLIVGFAWYWGVLPPLEVSQPCVLYPVLWMAGKSAIYRWRSAARGLAGRSDTEDNNNNDDDDDDDDDNNGWSGRGISLGGGAVGNSGGDRWTGSPAADDDDNEPVAAVLRALAWLAMGHWFGTLYMVWGDHGFVHALTNGTILGELLLLVILKLLVRAAAANKNNTGGSGGHPLASVGLLGRAYVAFVVVTMITDAMTLGGWWALSVFEGEGWGFAAFLLGSRMVLGVSTAAVVCHLLDGCGELQKSGNGGIWSHVLGSTVAEPGASLGRALVKIASLPACPSTPASTRTTPSTAADHTTPSLSSFSQGASSKDSGRSASNLAGKSRLVMQV